MMLFDDLDLFGDEVSELKKKAKVSIRKNSFFY